MSPRSVIPAACILFAAAPTHAQQVCTKGGAGLSWTYYGLDGGGPTIGYNSWAFPAHKKKSHHPPVATYDLAPGVIDVRGHHMVPPAHPGFGYGWLGYRTPSPRPKALSVSVYPPPPEPPAAAAAGACLKVEVKLPDGKAKVSFGGAETGGEGATRVYESPPLAAGQNYSYTITATWSEAGKGRTETRTVAGQPGETLTADFTK